MNKLIDMTEDAKMVSTCIFETGNRLGRKNIINILLGNPTESSNIKEKTLKTYDSYGSLKHYDYRDISGLIDKMLNLNYLNIKEEHYNDITYPILAIPNDTSWSDKIYPDDMHVELYVYNKRTIDYTLTRLEAKKFNYQDFMSPADIYKELLRIKNSTPYRQTRIKAFSYKTLYSFLASEGLITIEPMEGNPDKEEKRITEKGKQLHMKEEERTILTDSGNYIMFFPKNVQEMIVNYLVQLA